MSWKRLLPLLVLAACAHTPAVTEPAPREWFVHTSPHFEVSSDLEPSIARGLIDYFERTRGALCNWLGDGFDPPGREEIIIFARHDDFMRFAPKSMRGFVSDMRKKRTMVLSWVTSNSTSLSEVQVHELTHQLTIRRYARMPRWFGEGLSSWTETMQADTQSGLATLGYDNPNMRELILRFGAKPLRELWSWDPSLPGRQQAPFYASSWRAVRCLPGIQPLRWERFTSALQHGEDPAAAWQKHFAGVDANELERHLDACFRAEPDLQRVRLGSPGDVTTAKLPPAEVALNEVYLTLKPFAPGTGDEKVARAVAGLDQVLALDPDHARALCLRGALTGKLEETLVPLRALLGRRPDSVEGWSCLSGVLQSMNARGPELDAAFERAVALAPGDAHVLNNAAWHWASIGRGADALELARRAVALDPSEASYADTLAAALLATGRCTDAVEMQRHAVELLGHEQTARADGYFDRLAQYEKRCSSGALRDE